MADGVAGGADPEDEPVTVALVLGVEESDGGGVVGLRVGTVVCVAFAVGLGVIVCAGMTVTRGGGGGRTSR